MPPGGKTDVSDGRHNRHSIILWCFTRAKVGKNRCNRVANPGLPPRAGGRRRRTLAFGRGRAPATHGRFGGFRTRPDTRTAGMRASSGRTPSRGNDPAVSRSGRCGRCGKRSILPGRCRPPRHAADAASKRASACGKPTSRRCCPSPGRRGRTYRRIVPSSPRPACTPRRGGCRAEEAALRNVRQLCIRIVSAGRNPRGRFA